MARTTRYQRVSRIMHLHKLRTTERSWQLGHNGKLWQKGFHDRVLRGRDSEAGGCQVHPAESRKSRFGHRRGGISVRDTGRFRDRSVEDPRGLRHGATPWLATVVARTDRMSERGGVAGAQLRNEHDLPPAG